MPPTKAITVTEAVEAYLADRASRDYSEKSLANFASILRRFAREVGPETKKIQNLTPTQVSAWFYGPKGVSRALEPRTHNSYRSRLSGLSRWCQARGYIKVDFMIDVDPRKEIRKVRQQPPPAVLDQMLDLTTNERDRAFIGLAINTGMRQNELLRLVVSDVDLDEGWLRVYVSKSRVHDRMPLTIEADQVLRRWLSAYAADMARPAPVGQGRALRGDDRLFPARIAPRYTWVADESGTKTRTHTLPGWNPSKPMTHAERTVKGVLAQLGLDGPGEGCHTLRRAGARAYYDSLVADGYQNAIKIVSAWLHHADTGMTEAYLGMTAESEHRDRTLRGRSFLRVGHASADVVPLRREA